MNKQKLKIITLKISELTAYEGNIMAHGESHVHEIAESISRFGFNDPIGIDAERVVIEGHGRLMAAKMLGMKEVPCIDLSHMGEDQVRAYRIAHNKIAKNSVFDLEALRAEMDALEGFGFEGMGFSEEELSGLLEDVEGILPEGDLWSGVMGAGRRVEYQEGELGEVERPNYEPVQEHEAEELREEMQVDVVLGDLIEIGRHRLVCGDSTTVEAVDKVLGGVRPSLMVTDPPYGVEYDANWMNEAERADGTKYGASATGKVSNDSRADWTEAWALSPAKVAYVWHAAGVHTMTVGKSLEAVGFNLRYLIIWAKDLQVFGRGHYHHKHEPCWMGVKEGQTADWIGDRKQTTVWDIPTIHSFKNGNNAEEWGLNGVHSTQKPIECMARPMRNHAGDVYDPFGGSGTTMVAAQQLDRTCYMIELEPKYCQVIINRMRKAFPELEIKINGIIYQNG